MSTITLLRNIVIALALLVVLLVLVRPGPQPGWIQFGTSEVPYTFAYPRSLDPVTVDTNELGHAVVRGYGFGFLPLYAADYAAVQAVVDLPPDVERIDDVTLAEGSECLVFMGTESLGTTYYCPILEGDPVGVIGIFNGTLVPKHAEIMGTLRGR